MMVILKSPGAEVYGVSSACNSEIFQYLSLSRVFYFKVKILLRGTGPWTVFHLLFLLYYTDLHI